MLQLLAHPLHFIRKPSLPAFNGQRTLFRLHRFFRRGTYFTRYSWWRMRLSVLRTITKHPLLVSTRHYGWLSVCFLFGLSITGIALLSSNEPTKEPVITVIQGKKIVMPMPLFKPNVPLSPATIALAHKAPIFKPTISARKTQLVLRSGEGLAAMLQRESVPSSMAHTIINSLSKHMELQQLTPGPIMQAQWSNAGNQWQLKQLHVPLSATETLKLNIDSNKGSVTTERNAVPLSTQLAFVETDIEHSLLGSTSKEKVPFSLMMHVINELGHRVDFQRDIRQGDRFQMLYEQELNPEGKLVDARKFLYASLSSAGNVHIYRYAHNGKDLFFDEKGNSIRAGLLKTPVNGARISSNFGMRHHPVLGYSKMHKGMDFAAASGTPIYAAGDGIIEKKGRLGGYGNYIRIRHNNGFSTAYAHLKGFAKRVKQGGKITQGDVIGYVGTTGRSTGPHLHYEVLKAGKQINPANIPPQPRIKLTGTKLAAFKKHVSKLHKQVAVLQKENETKQYAQIQ